MPLACQLKLPHVYKKKSCLIPFKLFYKGERNLMQLYQEFLSFIPKERIRGKVFKNDSKPFSLFIHLFVYLFPCLFIYLFIYLFVCLFYV